MRFDAIAPHHFQRFHATFHGDTVETFAVCGKCGGACEFNKIGTLMPGEREYMAGVLGISAVEFHHRYLDVITMEDGVELDVLRLTDGCPFLNRRTWGCDCRAFKVVLCDLYPIVFRVVDGRVLFEIDDWCPIADTLRFRRHFFGAGVAALAQLPVPVDWYRHVARYDDLHFDYPAIAAARNDRSAAATYPFTELMRFQRAGLEHDPKQRFHPYPAEVLERRSARG